MFILWKRGYHTRKINRASIGSPIKKKKNGINKSVAESIKSYGFEKWMLLDFG